MYYVNYVNHVKKYDFKGKKIDIVDMVRGFLDTV